MMKPAVTLVPLLLIIFLISFSSADDAWGNFCDSNTNLTSKQSSNTGHLLSKLVSQVQAKGFIATSYGSSEDRVYGLAQCRGDVDSYTCSICINAASKQIRKTCPTQSDARIWYEYCFLRYSKVKFAGKVDTGFGLLFANTINVTDPVTFKTELGALFDRIDRRAIRPRSGGFGKGQVKLAYKQDTLYGLAQCTEDISKLRCARCLDVAIQTFNGFCRDKRGCRVLYSSCFVRYELYPIFFPNK